MTVLDWTAGPFLSFYVTLAGGAVIVAILLKERTRERASGLGPVGDLTLVEVALLSGGPDRAVDVIALGLVEAGHLVVLPDGRLQATSSPEEGPPELSRLWPDERIARADLADLFSPWFEPALDGLVRRGLVLSPAHLSRIRDRTASVVLPVVVLGLLKVMVGVGRDKPVGFLIALIVLTALAAYRVAQVEQLATGLGQRELSRLAKARARALRAPLPEEFLFAFAFEGATMLAGTALAAYATTARRSDGSGGCGGGGGTGGCGGGGGGGGCGGGGCGGCGGGD